MIIIYSKINRNACVLSANVFDFYATTNTNNAGHTNHCLKLYSINKDNYTVFYGKSKEDAEQMFDYVMHRLSSEICLTGLNTIINIDDYKSLNK